MRIIAGLGNPGAEYAGTRHNVGFDVIDVLAKRHSIDVSKRNFQSVYGIGEIAGVKTILVRPMTYMNLSGEAVAAIARYYQAAAADIIVISDDVALPPGRLRLRYKGSAGGHNGLSNIFKLLQTQEIARVRIGVGAAVGSELRGHVLSRFRKEEVSIIREAIDHAADAIECALREGFETAMNRYNGSA